MRHTRAASRPENRTSRPSSAEAPARSTSPSPRRALTRAVDQRMLARHLRASSRIASVAADMADQVQDLERVAGAVSGFSADTAGHVKTFVEEAARAADTFNRGSDAAVMGRESATELHYSLGSLQRLAAGTLRELDRAVEALAAGEDTAGAASSFAGEMQGGLSVLAASLAAARAAAARIDIAAANIALTAAKSTGDSPVAVSAEALRSTAAAFVGASGAVTSTMARYTDTVDGIAEAVGAAVERLRTASVLVNGLVSGARDDASSLAVLAEDTEELSLVVEDRVGMGESAADQARALGNDADGYRAAVATAFAGADDLGQAVANVQESELRLAAAVASFVDVADTAAADAVYDAAGDFMDVLDGVCVPFDAVLSSFDAAARDLDAVMGALAGVEGGMADMGDALVHVIDAADASLASAETLEERHREARRIHGELGKEIHLLDENTLSLGAAIRTHATLSVRMGRHAQRCGSFADMVAAFGAVIGTGAKAAGVADDLCDGIGDAASDLRMAGAGMADALDGIDDQFAQVGADILRETALTIGAILDALGDREDETTAHWETVSGESAMIRRSLEEYRDATTQAADSISRAAGASQAVQAALATLVESASAARTSIDTLPGQAERLSTLADDVAMGGAD